MGGFGKRFLFSIVTGFVFIDYNGSEFGWRLSNTIAAENRLGPAFEYFFQGLIKVQ